MSIDELETAAAELTNKERGILASRLLHGLEEPQHFVSDEEIFARVKEGNENPDSLISHEELMAGIVRAKDSIQ